MSITYTWKIVELKVKDHEDLENVVVQTHWEKIGTDENDNTGTFKGATPLSLENVNFENFIPFEQLTESQVLQWIQNIVSSNSTYEEHINSCILKEIFLKNNPIVEKTLPWATSNT